MTRQRQSADAGVSLRSLERRDSRPFTAGATLAGAATLVDVLRARACESPARLAFTVLADGERVTSTLTYAALDAGARAVAALLQANSAPGDRALLLVSEHAAFLRAFLGCVYAGTIAVPTQPVGARARDRLSSLAGDAGPRVVLTTRQDRERAEQFTADVPELRAAAWIDVDAIVSEAAADWRAPPIHADTLALLQYTSGSTGAPKGVMVTHGNLMRNAIALHGLMPLQEDSVVVTWLPVFHDMGLMGGVIQPLCAGAMCVLMPPAAFVQRPARWLQAIGRHKATVTGAPNFAYDVCVDRVTPADRRDLDLRSLQTAVCASEPISAKTLDRFTRAFAPCGFRPDMLSPAYGLAEATLLVTGTRPSESPVVVNVDAERLRAGVCVPAVDDARARALVSSGIPMPGVDVIVVDPVARIEKRNFEVGEIWVHGGGVAAGYWQKPAASEATMGAQLATDPLRRFLRTGDLGFIADGALFVLGRGTDMIVVRGRNHAPQDVERTAERAHESLAEHSSAAFLAEIDGAEGLVIVAEARRRKDLPDVAVIAGAVRSAVAEDHGLELHALALLVPHALPRTTSGKVRRLDARDEWASGTLRTIARWTRTVARDTSTPVAARAVDSSAPSALEIEAWLVARVAQLLGAHPSEIDPHAPATTLGLGSHDAVATAGSLGEWLGRPLSATILFDGTPSLHALAVKLAGDPPAVGETRAPARAARAVTAHEARRLLRELDRLSPNEIDELLRTVGSDTRDDV